MTTRGQLLGGLAVALTLCTILVLVDTSPERLLVASPPASFQQEERDLPGASGVLGGRAPHPTGRSAQPSAEDLRALLACLLARWQWKDTGLIAHIFGNDEAATARFLADLMLTAPSELTQYQAMRALLAVVTTEVAIEDGVLEWSRRPDNKLFTQETIAILLKQGTDAGRKAAASVAADRIATWHSPAADAEDRQQLERLLTSFSQQPIPEALPDLIEVADRLESIQVPGDWERLRQEDPVEFDRINLMGVANGCAKKAFLAIAVMDTPRAAEYLLEAALHDSDTERRAAAWSAVPHALALYPSGETLEAFRPWVLSNLSSADEVVQVHAITAAAAYDDALEALIALHPSEGPLEEARIESVAIATARTGNPAGLRFLQDALRRSPSPLAGAYVQAAVTLAQAGDHASTTTLFDRLWQGNRTDFLVAIEALPESHIQANSQAYGSLATALSGSSGQRTLGKVIEAKLDPRNSDGPAGQSSSETDIDAIHELSADFESSSEGRQTALLLKVHKLAIDLEHPALESLIADERLPFAFRCTALQVALTMGPSTLHELRPEFFRHAILGAATETESRIVLTTLVAALLVDHSSVPAESLDILYEFDGPVELGSCLLRHGFK